MVSEVELLSLDDVVGSGRWWAHVQWSWARAEAVVGVVDVVLPAWSQLLVDAGSIAAPLDGLVGIVLGPSCHQIVEVLSVTLHLLLEDWLELLSDGLNLWHQLVAGILEFLLPLRNFLADWSSASAIPTLMV